MMKILPSKHDNVFFTNSGSEETDNAIKIARMSTNKPNIICMKGGFHGRTLCAMSITSSKISYRQGFQPLIPGVFFSDDNIENFENVLEYQTAPNETCAFIMEPIIGEGGIKEISPQFVKKVKKICTENNIKLIFDEVQCGAGRTGNWWVSDKWKIQPDIMTFAKGISSGFPIGGVSANSEIFDTMSKNSLGGTYNGNVISTVAASQTIDIINEENLLNAQVKGKEIKKKLQDLPYIDEVRQYGLFIGVDINEHFDVKDIIEKAIQHRLILISCGKNTLRIIPPLNITSEEIDYFIYKLNLTLNML
jgi:acetylornithine/succinyldiaminopimelate/putrescine aminotransferase